MKNSHYLILISLLSFLFIACGSGDKLKEDVLLIDVRSVKSAKKIEQTSLGGVYQSEITKSKGSFKGEKDTFEDVALFIRNRNGKYPLKTKYYFKEGEDTVRMIHYEWTKDLPGMTTKERDMVMSGEEKKLEAYGKKFHQIAVQLGYLYGKPLDGYDGKLRKEKFEALQMWKKQFMWENEKEKVDLSLVWIPKTGYQIHKIYCKVYFK
ncbi:MAG: hypothetical protein GY827_09555 [Cytophagales bacterium]|nr:hypothetical protein [Cytophagales bacterium]